MLLTYFKTEIIILLRKKLYLMVSILLPLFFIYYLLQF